jgi:hypothetical protein
MDPRIEKLPLPLPPGYSCAECRTDIDFVSDRDDPRDSCVKDADTRISVHMAGCKRCWDYFANKRIPVITRTA